MSILFVDEQCECKRLTIKFRSPVPAPAHPPRRARATLHFSGDRSSEAQELKSPHTMEIEVQF